MVPAILTGGRGLRSCWRGFACGLLLLLPARPWAQIVSDHDVLDVLVQDELVDSSLKPHECVDTIAKAPAESSGLVLESRIAGLAAAGDIAFIGGIATWAVLYFAGEAGRYRIDTFDAMSDVPVAMRQMQRAAGAVAAAGAISSTAAGMIASAAPNNGPSVMDQRRFLVQWGAGLVLVTAGVSIAELHPGHSDSDSLKSLLYIGLAAISWAARGTGEFLWARNVVRAHDRIFRTQEQDSPLRRFWFMLSADPRGKVGIVCTTSF